MHLIRGFSHRPLTHSFAQAGWYPDLPVRRLSNRRGYTSSRPRKSERKSAIFSWGGEDRETNNGGGALGTMVSLAAIRCSVSLREPGVALGLIWGYGTLVRRTTRQHSVLTLTSAGRRMLVFPNRFAPRSPRSG